MGTGPTRLGAWLVISGERPGPTKVLGCSPTRPSDAPKSSPLSNFPGFSSQQHLQPRSRSCDPQARWIRMLPQDGIDDSSTRGLRPNPTPGRRRRRITAHGHTQSHGPDGRSCPHCGRTFKRTEHLDRHVRTRQSSQPVSPPFRNAPDTIGVKLAADHYSTSSQLIASRPPLPASVAH